MTERMQRVTAQGFDGSAPIWLYKDCEISRDGAAWVVHRDGSPEPIVRTFSRRACAVYIDHLGGWSAEEWVEFWAGFYEADEG